MQMNLHSVFFVQKGIQYPNVFFVSYKGILYFMWTGNRSEKRIGGRNGIWRPGKRKKIKGDGFSDIGKSRKGKDRLPTCFGKAEGQLSGLFILPAAFMPDHFWEPGCMKRPAGR